jgi:hypothetical protein
MTFNIDTIPENKIKEFLLYLIDNANTYTESQYTDFKKYSIDDKVECVVCLTENASVKCDTGNHLYACSDCYEKLRLTTDDRCPVCRAPNTIPLIVDTQTYTFERPFRQTITINLPPPPATVVHSPPLPLWRSYDNIENLSNRLVNYIDRKSSWNFNYNLDKDNLFDLLMTQPLDFLLMSITRNKCLIIFSEDTDEELLYYFGVFCAHRKRYLILNSLNDYSKRPEDRDFSMYKQQKTIDRRYTELTSRFGIKKFIVPTVRRSVRIIFMSYSEEFRNHPLSI